KVCKGGGNPPKFCGPKPSPQQHSPHATPVASPLAQPLPLGEGETRKGQAGKPVQRTGSLLSSLREAAPTTRYA
ncbi:MAG: hypothetical protein RMY34_10665, partial [Aulosira sp. DedQUE10]|nr:hypothetical protein [Aulosira sp. DedQUE10]